MPNYRVGLSYEEDWNGSVDVEAPDVEAAIVKALDMSGDGEFDRGDCGPTYVWRVELVGDDAAAYEFEEVDMDEVEHLHGRMSVTLGSYTTAAILDYLSRVDPMVGAALRAKLGRPMVAGDIGEREGHDGQA